MSEESPISYSQLRDLEDDFEDIDLQMRKLPSSSSLVAYSRKQQQPQS